MAEWQRVEVPADWEHNTKTWDAITSSWDTVLGGWDYSLAWAEECSLGDAVAKTQNFKSTEAITFSETFSDYRDFLLRFVDSLNLEDKKSLHRFIPLAEPLHLADTLTKCMNKQISVDLSMSEAFTDERIVLRLFHETFGLVDKSVKQAQKTINQACTIIDEQLRNSNAVISDIVISTNDIRQGVPAGYSEWLPFVSGDYTYREALIRSVMSVASPDNKSVLSEFCVKVDLPDIQDHGVIDIEARETSIDFELDFYRPPEITVTNVASAGVAAIPVIISVTRKGFTIKLVNPAGELTGGKISWSALGC